MFDLIQLDIVTDEKLGVVTVVAFNEYGSAVGSSRCSGPDKFDSEIGVALATSRALKKLARGLDKMARETVDERDRVRDAAEVTRVKNLEDRKARGAALKEERRIGANNLANQKAFISNKGF